MMMLTADKMIAMAAKEGSGSISHRLAPLTTPTSVTASKKVLRRA